MSSTEYDILSLFKEKPNTELSTSDIVEGVYDEEFSRIKDKFSNPLSDKARIFEAKREKASLHRKVLYYLNKLANDDILKIMRQGNKGEKFFALSISQFEELQLERNKRHITIIKHEISSPSLDGYSEKNIFFKYDKEAWASKLNSILISSKHYNNIDVLYKTVSSLFPIINDVIALNDFEHIVFNNPIDRFKKFLVQIEQDCNDYGKTACLIFDAKNFKEGHMDSLFSAVRHYSIIKPKHIRVIFDLKRKDLQRFQRFFEGVIKLFSQSKIKLYIKNDSVHTAPYILGKAGPYTFNEDEWKLYANELSSKVPCLSCGHISVAVDIAKFFESGNSVSDFRSFMLKTVQALFTADSMQRSNSEIYFRKLINMNRQMAKEIFWFGRNYIRLWNYFSAQNNQNFDMLKLLESVKKDIDNFCLSQETIYQACGMPTRFKTVFSCAFDDFAKEKLKEQKFSYVHITNTSDMHAKEIMEQLSIHEDSFNILDGGERLRVYRNSSNAEELLHEVNVILSSFNIPFICYDFGEIRGKEIKLTSFF